MRANRRIIFLENPYPPAILCFSRVRDSAQFSATQRRSGRWRNVQNGLVTSEQIRKRQRKELRQDLDAEIQDYF